MAVLANTKRQPNPFRDGRFLIVPNENTDRIWFLVELETGVCCGGIDFCEKSNLFQVSITKEYDQGTDSDTKSIGRHVNLAEAKKLLWSKRYNAVC